MVKKLIDIFPAKELKRETPLPEKRGKEVFFESPISQPKKVFPFPFRKIIFWLLFFLLILGFFHFSLARVRVEIWPVISPISLETKLEIDPAIEEPNFASQILPGTIFQKEKTFLEEFPTTGGITEEGRAEGTIRVFNEYSTFPQTLVANTRFISDEGKTFRSVEKITIPGGHYERGKLVPGYLDIKVRADQPGEDYNIDPSTFSIPGFAGTDRYTKFYGQSFKPMVGGFRKRIPQLKKEDLEKAKEILSQKAKEETESALKEELSSEKISSQFYFLPEAIKFEILEDFPLSKEGEKIERFGYQLKGLAKAISFKKEDLKNFSLDFIKSKIEADKRIYPPSLKINYSPEFIDKDLKKIRLSLSLEGKIFLAIDEEILKKGIAGKTKKEGQFLLKNQPEIANFNLRFLPFWLKKFPEDLERIEIHLKFD